MRATSAATCAFVISLLKQGYSVRDLEKRTNVRKSAVGRIKEVMNTDQEKKLVDVLPSFLLLMIKHPLVIKFNQEGWILLFRLPI